MFAFIFSIPVFYIFSGNGFRLFTGLTESPHSLSLLPKRAKANCSLRHYA